jgi:hypothetical protein
MRLKPIDLAGTTEAPPNISALAEQLDASVKSAKPIKPELGFNQ